MALYKQRLQQVLSLARGGGGGDSGARQRRRRRIKVIGLLPQQQQQQQQQQSYKTTDVETSDTDDDDEGGVRRRLHYDSSLEDEGAWEDLSTQARQILPRSVAERALTLLRRLVDGGYLGWVPGTFELMVNGARRPGTNVIDLAGHAVRDRRSGPLRRGSPGPPPGFSAFARALRQANASRELVRNRRRWPVIYHEGMQSSPHTTTAPEEEEEEEEEEEAAAAAAAAAADVTLRAPDDDDDDDEDEFRSPMTAFKNWTANA